MSSRRLIPLVVLVLLSVSCSPPRDRSGKTAKREPWNDPASSEMLGKLPVSFVENRGQVPDRDIAHYVNTPTTSIGFSAEGLRLFLTDARSSNQRWGLALDFVGGRADPTAVDRQAGVVSYFKGDPTDWKTGIPTYGRLIFRDLWPDIDLVYRSDGPGLKYELVVHPGGDPNDIRFRWRGTNEVAVGSDGSLTVSTPVGAISDGVPLSFQGRREVATSYDLRGTTYGFRLGRYDRTRTLVIDPVLVPYAGYIGGTASDQGFGIDVDASGAAYVTGEIHSDATSFPATVGPTLTYSGGEDVFVVKVNPSGTALLYAGYIGGSGHELGYDIEVDGSGAAYVTGPTTSDPVTFPETVGPSLFKGMGTDAFVAKVNPAGTALVYAGYIGGAGEDTAHGIAVDGDGAAYIAGNTDSDAASFPDTVGPDLTYNGGFSDAFVAKVNPSGTALSYAGYIGGAGNEPGEAIDVDAAGAAYVTGYTDSDAATFPVTGGPSLTKNVGEDAFVAKVNPSGASLSYAGYIGGNATDFGQGIAVDPAGAAYVTGLTLSAPGTFPEIVGPDVTHNGGLSEAFVAKVNPSGNALSYSGYIGGSGEEGGEGIAVDASGNAYVIGGTNSDSATFPVAVGPDVSYNGGGDAFVAKVSASGTNLSYAGYLGGTSGDRGLAIAHGAGAAYMTGDTDSDALSFPVTVGPDVSYNGGFRDAYVAKVTDNLCLGKGVTIQGTGDADTLTGTAGSDVILGLGGNDTIDGGGGNDTICAGDGDDLLVGGEGDDALDGEGGLDAASFPGVAAVTVDLLAGIASGASTDTLAGIENLIGSSGKDVLRGNDGPNRLQGGSGGDRLSGRKGSDRLAGQAGADNLQGGRGNDRLFGGRGRDRLNGGKGSKDRCSGGKGDDTATGCEKVTGA
jgi:Ca2+-binding RTX toxin-like protein